VVNNAGLNFMGDTELSTMDQYVSQANINQLGVVRVTKAFLPEIRRCKGQHTRIVFSLFPLAVEPLMFLIVHQERCVFICLLSFNVGFVSSQSVLVSS